MVLANVGIQNDQFYLHSVFTYPTRLLVSWNLTTQKGWKDKQTKKWSYTYHTALLWGCRLGEDKGVGLQYAN